MTVGSASIGLREYSANVVPGTLGALTFSGQAGIAVPAGGRVFPFVADTPSHLLRGRNLAVSFIIAGQVEILGRTTRPRPPPTLAARVGRRSWLLIELPRDGAMACISVVVPRASDTRFAVRSSLVAKLTRTWVVGNASEPDLKLTTGPAVLGRA
jgi:hypothetical protein